MIGRESGIFNQRLSQERIAEDVDTHGSIVAFWLFWFFLEFDNLVFLISDDNAETVRISVIARNTESGYPVRHWDVLRRVRPETRLRITGMIVNV